MFRQLRFFMHCSSRQIYVHRQQKKCEFIIQDLFQFIIKTPEEVQQRGSSAFIIELKQIQDIKLVFSN